MQSHFPLNVKIKLENNFPLSCSFLNTFKNSLYLIKLRSENIAIDLRHHVQKKNTRSEETEIDFKKVNGATH